ncbi:MAG: FolC bifunctional protein [Acidobacteria bacterium]|nr:FolC bifunctional protein [Acidobacteriota bacterium]
MSLPPVVTPTAEALLAPRQEQRVLPGLERIERALAALGHPERAFPSALVLGTNGKGSTAALLEGILRAHGVRTGLYTSPHLLRVEERIRVAGEWIASGELRDLVAGLAHFPELSYFETLTAAAFLHFAGNGVSLAVLEAGLGGRWDATRAAAPAVTLLTNVGTDHAAWLGPTRLHVAREKAAALGGRAAIVGAWDDEVEATIREHAAADTPLSLAADWASVTPDQDGAVRFAVGGVAGGARLRLAGRHQLDNLALALAGAAALARLGLAPTLEAAAVRRGVEAVRWPGRLEWRTWDGRRLLLDGAHNREAVAALVAALPDAGLAGPLHLLFSCLDDKPLAAMADLLRPHVCGVTVVPLSSPRATPPAALAAAFPGCRMCPDVATALAELPAGASVLVTGSLRLVGAVLELIGGDDV